MLNIAKSLVRNNPNDSQNIPSGITLSNYCQEPHPRCRDVSYLLTKKKSKKSIILFKNI